jgi:hypothetical protein
MVRAIMRALDVRAGCPSATDPPLHNSPERKHSAILQVHKQVMAGLHGVRMRACAGPASLKVRATHEARINVHPAQRDATAFFKVEVQVLHVARALGAGNAPCSVMRSTPLRAPLCPNHGKLSACAIKYSQAPI